MKDLLRHLFVPHESNNHRAKALHMDTMFLYVAVFVLFNVAIRTIHSNYPDVLGYATNIQAQQLLADTNAQRVSAGLQPLMMNQALSQAAAQKAADMFAKNYWAHIGPQGETPWDFIIASGYKYSVAGENLAKNFQDSAGVVTAWMNSPSHRDNMLKPSYRDVGFAVVNGKLQGEDTTLVVQMFGTPPLGTVAEVPPSKPVAIAPSPAAVPVVSPVAVQPVVQPKTQAKAVVVPPLASATENSQQAVLSFPFSSSIKTPAVDITSLKTNVTIAFAGILVGIFVVDFYFALKRKTVRAVGSTAGHVLFLAALLFSMNSILHGAIL